MLIRLGEIHCTEFEINPVSGFIQKCAETTQVWRTDIQLAGQMNEQTHERMDKPIPIVSSVEIRWVSVQLPAQQSATTVPLVDLAG